MHVMVTGGSGFVGSAVVRRLLSAGYDVRVFVRRTSDLRNLDGLDVHIVYGDLRDPTTFDLALRATGSSTSPPTIAYGCVILSRCSR